MNAAIAIESAHQCWLDRSILAKVRCRDADWQDSGVLGTLVVFQHYRASREKQRKKGTQCDNSSSSLPFLSPFTLIALKVNHEYPFSPQCPLHSSVDR